MPRRKATPTPTPAVTPPPILEQALQLEPTAWSDVLGEIEAAGDVSVHVYQEPERGQGGAAYCFACSVEEFPQLTDLFDHIKAHPDCGPGRYSIRTKKGNLWTGRKNIVIAGRKRSAEAPAVAPAAPVADTKHQEFLQNMVLALIARPAAEGTSIGEIAKVFSMLNENRTPPPDPIEQLKKAFELKALIAPEPEDRLPDGEAGNPLSALISTFGPAIVATMQRPAAPQAVRQAPPVRRPPAAIASASAPPPPAPAPPAASEYEQPAEIRLLFSMLLRGIEMGSDPGDYAVPVLDVLGDQAELLLRQPNALDLLCQIEPRAADHREWFGRLVDECRELLGDDESQTADGGGLTAPETGADGSPNVDEPAAAS